MIRIIRNQAFCTATATNGVLTVNRHPKQCCCSDRYTLHQLSQCDCLVKTVGLNNEFLFSAVWDGGVANCTGLFEKIGQDIHLTVTRQLGGDHLKLHKNENFIITPFRNFCADMLVKFDNSVLTSEGIVELKSLTGNSADSLQLTPTTVRPQKPMRGTFIYNKITDRPEYFNGDRWVEI